MCEKKSTRVRAWAYRIGEGHGIGSHFVCGFSNAQSLFVYSQFYEYVHVFCCCYHVRSSSVREQKGKKLCDTQSEWNLIDVGDFFIALQNCAALHRAFFQFLLEEISSLAHRVDSHFHNSFISFFFFASFDELCLASELILSGVTKRQRKFSLWKGATQKEWEKIRTNRRGPARLITSTRLMTIFM